jgi:hypothetical protein
LAREAARVDLVVVAAARETQQLGDSRRAVAQGESFQRHAAADRLRALPCRSPAEAFAPDMDFSLAHAPFGGCASKSPRACVAPGQRWFDKWAWKLASTLPLLLHCNRARLTELKERAQRLRRGADLPRHRQRPAGKRCTEAFI